MCSPIIVAINPKNETPWTLRIATPVIEQAEAEIDVSASGLQINDGGN
jgi:hypothetical protein